jgi:hypothetical protein
VVTPPAHGEIRIVHEEGFAYFPPNNPRSRCDTQRVPGIRVIYQDAPDYRGPDACAVEIFHVNGVLFRNAINVDVQQEAPDDNLSSLENASESLALSTTSGARPCY